MTVEETIEGVRQRKGAGLRLRKWESLLLLLADYEPHGTWEMVEASSHRFSEYLRQLREKGCEVEVEDIPGKATKLYTMRRGDERG